jgi:RHS repeat-associated protein
MHGKVTQRYQFGNNIESATLELDENANTISYEEYYPYGETSYRAGRNIAEVGLKRYRYTGKEKDEESGLYYYGARYYAPWLGRWTAADPAGTIDGLNLYMYCRGSPANSIDPEGEFTIDTEKGIGTIEEGDTLNEITKQINKKFGTELSVGDVAADNDIEDPDKIYAGGTIGLPEKEKTNSRKLPEYIIGECGVKNFEVNFKERIIDPAKNENSLNKIGVRFEFKAEFYREEDGSNYNPYCCEYIQEVKGFVIKNGEEVTDWDKIKNKECKTVLSQEEYNRDCYGRDMENILIEDQYNDSLGTYKGSDYPGLKDVELGDSVNIRMEFKSYIKDRCDSNKVVEVKPWVFKLYGTVPNLKF